MIIAIVLFIMLIFIIFIILRKYELFKQDPDEQLVQLFNKYLHNTQKDWNYILPKDFNTMDKSNLFILDIRRPDDFKKGHIKGATNIFWLDLMKPENLKRLPKDKEIIVVCYVGHTSSQILVMLKLLGYKVKVLKFGMGRSPSVGVPVAGWFDYGYEVTTK